jgi:hypothetical protein
MTIQIAIIQSLPSVDSGVALVSAVLQAGMEATIVTTHHHNLFDGYVIDNVEKNNTQLIEILRREVKIGKPLLSFGEESANILAETGLIPGIENDRVGLVLKEYQEPAVYKAILPANEYQYNAFTRFVRPSTRLNLADDQLLHKEFSIPPGLLLEMQANGLDVFHYCDDSGKRLDTVAAIANKAGNVMAMMPELSSAALDIMFQSMREYILKGYKQIIKPLYYYPR